MATKFTAREVELAKSLYIANATLEYEETGDLVNVDSQEYWKLAATALAASVRFYEQVEAGRE